MSQHTTHPQHPSPLYGKYYILCYNNRFDPTPVWDKFCNYCWDNRLSRDKLLIEYNCQYVMIGGVEYIVFDTDAERSWFILKWAP